MASVAPCPDRYIPADPLSGLRPDPKDATIAVIAALTTERDAWVEASSRAEERIATLTTDRDTLRLEVQRLKDLNFEAQDRYAALEAERDEARRASETVHSHYVLALKQRDEAVADTRAECDKGYEALFQAHQRMVAERDELKTKVDELTNTTWKLRSEGVEERARAESYLRVIEAKDAEILAALRLRSATIRTIAAMSAASLEFREVDADEKEADHE
jgi:chromosome segregation ATPase